MSIDRHFVWSTSLARARSPPAVQPYQLNRCAIQHVLWPGNSLCYPERPPGRHPSPSVPFDRLPACHPARSLARQRGSPNPPARPDFIVPSRTPWASFNSLGAVPSTPPVCHLVRSLARHPSPAEHQQDPARHCDIGNIHRRAVITPGPAISETSQGLSQTFAVMRRIQPRSFEERLARLVRRTERQETCSPGLLPGYSGM